MLRQRLTLLTLGKFSMSVGTTRLSVPSTNKARAILAFLAMHRGRDVSRERLTEIFWVASDPQRARDSLNTALHSIRRCFRSAGLNADDFVVATRSVVRWIANTDIDAERLTELQDSPTPHALRAATRAYRGEFLEGAYEDWAVEQRERLSIAYERALVAAVRELDDTQAARELLELNPYEESAYLLLLEAEVAAGRPLAASALAARARGTFSGNGASLSPELERSLARVASVGHGEPTLAFVGRERERAAMESALRRALEGAGTALIVCGDAGIGKTTLLDRCAHLATSIGVRVSRVQAVARDPRRFGPWSALCDARVSSNAAAIAATIAEKLRSGWLLAVDDAHHLEGESLDVLSMLANLATSLGCVVAVATRPEGYGLLRQRLCDARHEAMVLALLSAAEVRRGLRAAGIADDRLASDLYARSAGHPLFVNGLLRQLADASRLVRTTRGWIARANPSRSEIELPTSLVASVEDRLRSRGSDAATVACAIAWRPNADVAQLTAAVSLEEASVLDAIDDLLALGILCEHAGGNRLTFSHDVYADVAKTLVALPRRRWMCGRRLAPAANAPALRSA